MSELKPCPFCGGQPDIREQKADGINYGRDGFVVTCYECEPDEICSVFRDIEECAIDAWNHRPIEDALRAEIERLKGALTEARDSLMTISKSGGRDSGLEDLIDVRGYANSRGCVASAALNETTVVEELTKALKGGTP